MVEHAHGMERLVSLVPHRLARFLVARFAPTVYRERQRRREDVTADGYSYRSFDEYRCIFIHIPKCAGMSINRTLFNNHGGGHAPIGRYRIIYSPEEFRDYFKFAFVRNPWDRAFSAYNFLRKGGLHTGDQRWAKRNLAAFRTFNDFVRRGLRRRRILNHLHFRPQHTFVCEPLRRKPSVDFIGYYENLHVDFARVYRRLTGRASAPHLFHGNRSRSTANSTYVDHYSREAREIVADLYRRDVALFGYDFENASLRFDDSLAFEPVGGR
jgi:hypothetical protein